MNYHELEEIKKRARWYKPKKTQPDGEIFRQDVIALLQLLDQWQSELGEFSAKVKI